MAKPLDDILKQARDRISGRDQFAGEKKVIDTKTSLGKEPGVDYRPKAGDEQKFADAHSVEKHEYPYGNEAMFTGEKTGYSLDAQVNQRMGNDLKQSMDAAFSIKKEEKEVEEKTCNMTEAGKWCPVHEMRSCMEMKKINEKEIDEAKASPAQQKKVEKTMREFGKGKLHSGSKKGPVVTSRKQAVAIALSQAGMAKKKMKEEVEQVDEKVHMTKADIAALAEPKNKIDAKDLAALRAGKHKKKMNEDMGPAGAVEPLLGSTDPDAHHDREESEMARTQLKALANKAMHLVMSMPENVHVEPWVQSKIAVAKEMVSAVHDYLMYGDHDKKPEDEQMDTPMTFPNMSVDVNTGQNV